MLKEGWETEEHVKNVEKEIETVVGECITFANQSPFPDPTLLHEDVYVEN